MIKKPVVLFLPKWYPNKFDPFNGNFIENHALAISEKTDVCVLFVQSDETTKQDYLIQVKKIKNLLEVRCYFKKPKTGFSYLDKIITAIRYFKAQKKAFRHIQENYHRNFDLTHIHVLSRTAPFAVWLKKKKKIPFGITEHWSGYTKESNVFKGYFRKKFYRYIAKESGGITCVSNYLKEAMENHGIQSSYSIIPNVVDTNLFQIKNHQSNQFIRIVHISNLSKTPKNIHLIVEALNKVGSIRDDFEVDFIGAGPDQDFMLAELQNSSIKNRFRFHGEIELKKVAEILKNADFLLLYSQFETQSVVMIEAFASGVPVLASNVGGIPEYMSKERGILVPPNSKEELEKGLIQMLSNIKNYDPKKLREYAINNFSIERIQKQFLSFYNQIQSNG